MNYKKYIKYKTKYLNLKNQIFNEQKINRDNKLNENNKYDGYTFNDYWLRKEKQREEELKKLNLKNTKSFISRETLNETINIYCVHDNGGRPFKVVINSNGITIYKLDTKDDLDKIIKNGSYKIMKDDCDEGKYY